MENCEEFATYFIRTITHRAQNYTAVHLVFDRYDVAHSLKERTRNLQQKGSIVYFHDVSDTTAIKIPLKKFLSSNKTKDKLSIYLTRKALNHFLLANECLVVSTKEGAQSHSVNTEALMSNQEEAGMRLILHGLYASKLGHTVHIRSPDTDVFILVLICNLNLEIVSA